jgi:hypothetical protein
LQGLAIAFICESKKSRLHDSADHVTSAALDGLFKDGEHAIIELIPGLVVRLPMRCGNSSHRQKSA